MKLLKAEAGSVTAELSVALPALVLLIIFGLGQMRAFSERADTAADLAQYARALARQEPEHSVSRWFQKRHPSAHIKKTRQGGALCVETSVPSDIGEVAIKHCVWLGDF